MTRNSKIPWTDHTFNPWWGCAKVSPGCKNCYAAAFDHRLGGEHWGVDAPRKFQSDKYWDAPLRWNEAAVKAGKRPRVFCGSMCDVFEMHSGPIMVQLYEARQRLWRLIERTPHLDWLLLTKRPENSDLVPADWSLTILRPRNVWLGVTAENQEHADTRIPRLLASSWPAKRFVSYEPAIGPVDFDPPYCQYGCCERYGRDVALGTDGATPFCGHCESEMGFGAWLDPLNGGIDWVIAGAESGHGARPMNEDWIRAVRDQCERAYVPFMYKQKIEDGKKVELPLLDGAQWAQFPVASEVFANV